MPSGAGAVAGGAGAMVLGTLLVAGAFVYDMGAVRVSVRGKSPGGENIRLIVPAAAVPVVLEFVPDAKLQEAAEEARPWLPVIEAVSEELARCPDGPLVEVSSPHEKVSIVKQGDSLIIDVDDANETVHISVPLKVVGIVARQIGRVPLPKADRALEPAAAQSPAL